MNNLIHEFSTRKKAGERFASLTAYDYPMGRLLDEAGLDFILVGDSLGMVVLGHPDTTSVTLADMVHHTKAVGRGVNRTLLVADLPIHSADRPEEAIASARQLLDAGAKAVKLEGGREVTPIITTLSKEGIEVMGHIGMLPQRVREEGGYRIKGKTSEEASRLMADAEALVEAGVFCIVLELVHPPLARAITEKIPVPTIGIGSGPECDGQILVSYDLLGFFPWFKPRFVQPKADVASQVQSAVQGYIQETKKAHS